jgi:hypothetical protein
MAVPAAFVVGCAFAAGPAFLTQAWREHRLSRRGIARPQRRPVDPDRGRGTHVGAGPRLTSCTRPIRVTI